MRAKATPDHKVGCKRIGFSNDWYPALAADHVELVTDRVEAITAGGVRTDDGLGDFHVGGAAEQPEGVS